MCITPRYTDTQGAATFNISCFTSVRKLETNDAFADQTQMPCEKYERWRNAHNSQQDNQQLPETSKLSTEGEQTQKYTISQIFWKNILLQPDKYHVLCKG